ncbi:hypothetical protein ANANG_G00117210 [Anguilla anguilla]|uniref:Uncharacterized protein n=1 Tax=Anguilla anguilla TaxID=7936 RepID=A0A9D3MCU4_ANGAN|nr:hypothetical protein ANANG_G00117210 [Anguilla anguilla]
MAACARHFTFRALPDTLLARWTETVSHGAAGGCDRRRPARSLALHLSARRTSSRRPRVTLKPRPLSQATPTATTAHHFPALHSFLPLS